MLKFKELKNEDLQNGCDCAFIALDITRDDVVKHLKSRREDEAFRRFLVPEMHALSMIEKLKLFQVEQKEQNIVNPETQVSLRIELESLLHTCSEQNLLLLSDSNPKKQELVEALQQQDVALEDAKQHLNLCNNELGLSEGDRLNFSELQKHFTEHQEDTSAKVYYTQAKELFDKADNTLRKVLLDAKVYDFYVDEYYAQKGWLAFQPDIGGTSILDAIAKMRSTRIVVWQAQNAGNKLKKIYQTQAEYDNVVHMQAQVKYQSI